MKLPHRFELVLVVLSLVASGCTSGHQRSNSAVLRVMTYNIHHGEGMDGNIDLPRIAAVIREAAADIVALQEVDKGVERTGRRDLGAELAQLTGMQCVFSNNYCYQGGEYGNAILTRFPVIAATNHLFHMIKAREQRGLLQLILDVRGRRLAFWNTHLDAGHDDAERWASVTEIEQQIKHAPDLPLIFCGDFNDGPESRVVKRMQELGCHDTWRLVRNSGGETVPAPQPIRRIDYIWILRPEMSKPLGAVTPATLASDHLPVIAEFEFPALSE